MVTTGATLAVLPSCAPRISSDGTRLGFFLAAVESRTMPSSQEPTDRVVCPATLRTIAALAIGPGR